MDQKKKIPIWLIIVCVIFFPFTLIYLMCKYAFKFLKSPKYNVNQKIIAVVGIIVAFSVLSYVGGDSVIAYVKIDKIDVESINFNIGDQAEIKTKLTPENYDVKIISTEYKVDDETIAKIVDNKIVAITEGETKVEVSIKDDRGNVVKDKAKIKVSMTAEQKKQKDEAELQAKRNDISTDEGIRIKDYCKQIVDSILKSPSTAEYPGSFLNPFEDWGMVKKNNLVTVSSYVDAQNSFGATVRSKFIIQLQMTDEGQGTATYVQFDGEVVSGKYKK